MNKTPVELLSSLVQVLSRRGITARIQEADTGRASAVVDGTGLIVIVGTEVGQRDYGWIIATKCNYVAVTEYSADLDASINEIADQISFRT